MRTIRAALWVVWLAGGAVTIAHAARPVDLAMRSPASSIVLETMASCAALLLAALAYGRWLEHRLLPDLVACVAFSLLAAANVVLALVPTLAGSDASRPSVRAAALVCGAVAALLFAASSLLPERVASKRRDYLGLPVLLLVVLTLAGALAVFASAAGWWSGGLSGAPSAEATADRGDVSVTVLQLTAAVAFAVASAGFVRRGRRGADPFLGWLAVTCALWALARLNFALTPSRLADQLTMGDWLRVAAYLVALVAAATEFTMYWRQLAQTAVLEERRRIARDLHDGLAQELSFILKQSRNGRSSAHDENRVALVARAAERALDESRRAIAALTRPVDEPLDVALAQQAEELGGRMGVRVVLDFQTVGHVGNDTREALLRIAREAITNAGRHGRPSKIVVRLVNGSGVTMSIADDGRGFRVNDPKVYTGERWGVVGMRERTEALGGRFTVESRPYGGTRVDVWVPGTSSH